MEDLGNILYIIIFIIISLLSATKDKNKKKKQKPKAQKPTPQPVQTRSTEQKPEPKKEKSPLELLEEMFNEPNDPEPIYVPPKTEYIPPVPEPVESHSAMKTEPKIDLPRKKKYIRKSKYAVNVNSLRKRLANPDSVKELIVTAEILGKPKAMQD